MEDTKVVLIGTGGYGLNYLNALFPSQTLEGITLRAVVDPFIKGAPYYEELKQKGLGIYESLDEFFLSREKVDLAVISSPIHTHYEYINKCFDNSLNVLCEKPVTISLERMDELIKREKETGLFAAVGYQLCFSKDVLSLKEDIINGLFGSPIRFKALRMMKRGDKYYKRSSWAGKIKVGRELILDSPLSNACAHQVQLMLFLLGKSIKTTGKVKSIKGKAEKARLEIENFDSIQIKIETEEGVPLYYYTSHAISENKVGPFCYFEFEKAVIKGDQNDNFVAYFKDGSVKEYKMEKGNRLEKLISASLALKNTGFLPVTLETSREHVKVVLLSSFLPIYLRLDAEKKEKDGDSWYETPGLSERYLKNFEDWKVE